MCWSLWLWLCRCPPLRWLLSLMMTIMMGVVGVVAGRLGLRRACLKGYLRASLSRKMPLTLVAFAVTARLRGHYSRGGAATADRSMRER